VVDTVPAVNTAGYPIVLVVVGNTVVVEAPAGLWVSEESTEDVVVMVNCMVVGMAAYPFLSFLSFISFLSSSI